MKYFKLRYTRFADKIEHLYLKVISALHLEDSDASRVFIGVVACVGLFYTCYLIDRIISMVSQAAETVIAIIY